MMRLIIIVLWIIYLCPTVNSEYELQSEELCIRLIDSLTYSTCYIIHLESKDTGNRMKLLSVKKHSKKECDKKLEVGRCYRMQTTLLKTTRGFTEIGYRLGEVNIYNDGYLIFSITDRVVKSDQVDGLCVKTP